MLSAAYDKTIRIWDLATAKEKRKLTAKTLNAAAFTSGRKIAITGQFHKTLLTIWDLKAGKALREFHGYRTGHGSNAIAISPDGRLLVAEDVGEDLCVLELATGQELLKFPAKRAKVRAVAFSPDGKRVISGMEDGTALIWDATAAYGKLRSNSR